MTDYKMIAIVMVAVLTVLLIVFLLIYRWRICCDIGKGEPRHQMLRYRSRTISSRISVDVEPSDTSAQNYTNGPVIYTISEMAVKPPPYEAESATPPSYNSIFTVEDM